MSKHTKSTKAVRRSTRKRKAPRTYISEFEAENIKRMYLEDIPDQDLEFVLSDTVVEEDKSADADYDPKTDVIDEDTELADEKELERLSEESEEEVS